MHKGRNIHVHNNEDKMFPFFFFLVEKELFWLCQHVNILWCLGGAEINSAHCLKNTYPTYAPLSFTQFQTTKQGKLDNQTDPGTEICDTMWESIYILQRRFGENLWILADWHTVEIFKFCENLLSVILVDGFAGIFARMDFQILLEFLTLVHISHY